MATMTENETFPEENPLSETATDCPIKAALGQVDGGGERHYLTSISPPEQIAQLAEVSPRAAEDSKIYAESIVNTVREPLLVLDTELRVKSANQSFYEMFGVNPTETINRPLYDLGDGQWNIPDLRLLLNEVLPDKKKVYDFRVEHSFPRIGTKTMLLNAREIVQQDSAARLILLAIEDVTVSSKAREKFRLAAEFAEAVLANMGEGLYTVDAEGRVTMMNPAAERLFGWSFEELWGRKMHEMTHHHRPDGTPFPAQECASLRVLKEGKPLVGHPDVFIRKDGTFFDVVYSSAPLAVGDEIGGLVVVFRDVSDRKRVEASVVALKDELARELSATKQLQSVSSLLIEGGTTQVLYDKILDAAVAIMHSDMASMQALDEEEDALRLLAWRGFDSAFGQIFKFCRPNTETSCSAARRTGSRVVVPDVEKCDFIVSQTALDNHRKTGIRAVQSTPLFSRSGRFLGMISTHWRNPHTPDESALRLCDILARQAADLIERKQAEHARGRLAAIVESSDDAIISKDLNGIIQTWNAGAERVFGYTAQEAIGKSVTMLIPADRENEEPAILERIRGGGRIEHYETIRRRKDGTLLDISLSVSPIIDEHGKVVGASKIARDVTERKRIEQEQRDLAVAKALREPETELARVTRALTVGELATSIAHEVNQPLSAVVTNAEACVRWLGGKAPNLHEAQGSLALIVRDANRASEMIRRIREFLKKDTQQIAPLDINDVVKEALDLARDDLLKRHVTLRSELSGDLPPVRGDRIQLQQVLLNLIMNGKDAMDSVVDGSRELTVISRKSGADGVRIAVRDSGVGATPEDLDRMFNAFFTTKPAGIGMGLSISRSIIEAHEGRIWAELNEGPGLTVQFSLPVEGENP
jgi:PAS domain S-box-containing protein